MEEDYIIFNKLTKSAIIPIIATMGSVGYDFFSNENIVIPPNKRKLVKTGIQMVIPKGHYGRIAPRSSLSFKYCIDVGAGVIDNDYRGEVCVLLINNGDDDFVVEKGDKIAQLILERNSILKIKTKHEKDESIYITLPPYKNIERKGGFGSTNKIKG